MASQANQDWFLEPIYLNEKMVLNCAAYVFQGYSLEGETREQTLADKSRSFKAGLTFLQNMISIGGEGQNKQSQTLENKSARRYTVGGLHMTLIDELRDRKMLRVVDPADLKADLADESSYIEMLAILRPIDLYSVVETILTITPIIAEMSKSLVKPLYDRHREQQWAQQVRLLQGAKPALPSPAKKQKGHGASSDTAGHHEGPPPDRFQLVLNNIDSFVPALTSILRQVEEDYRRSKQLEMVMWTLDRDPRPYGVVDLDLGDYEIDELRARLSGGPFHIIGKVTRVLDDDQSINLLQKSSLYSALALVNRIVEEFGQADGLASYRSGLARAREEIERFGLLELTGPAVRVSAMSVCI